MAGCPAGAGKGRRDAQVIRVLAPRHVGDTGDWAWECGGQGERMEGGKE